MQISTTFIANTVAVLVFVLPAIGIQIVDEGTLLETITQIAGIASTLYVFYGRYKAGGINAFGVRLK
jgi:Flp pilus assembly protein protease CpaA